MTNLGGYLIAFEQGDLRDLVQSVVVMELFRSEFAKCGITITEVHSSRWLVIRYGIKDSDMGIKHHSAEHTSYTDAYMDALEVWAGVFCGN